MKLTHKENQIISLISIMPMTNRELAAEIYGDSNPTTNRRIKVLFCKARKKLADIVRSEPTGNHKELRYYIERDV